MSMLPAVDFPRPDMSLPNLTLPGLPGIPAAERGAQSPRQGFGMVQPGGLLEALNFMPPNVTLGLPSLPSLPVLRQAAAVQAPSQAAMTPQPGRVQAPIQAVALPQPERLPQGPNFTLPDVMLPSLPRLGLPNTARAPMQASTQAPVPSQSQTALAPTQGLQLPQLGQSLQVPNVSLPNPAAALAPNLALASADIQALREFAQQGTPVQLPNFTLPDVALPALPRLGPLGTAQAPMQEPTQATVLAPFGAEMAQAPAQNFQLPETGQLFQVPNVSLPDLSLPNPARALAPNLATAAADAQALRKLAQPGTPFQAPSFTLPNLALPSLPPLESLGIGPASSEAEPSSQAAEVQSPAQGLSLPVLQPPAITLPDLTLPSLPPLPDTFVAQAPAQAPDIGSSTASPQVSAAAVPVGEAPAPALQLSLPGLPSSLQLTVMGLPLLAQPELPGMPFGQAPAASTALPVTQTATDSLATAIVQGPTPLQARALAPSVVQGSSNPLSQVESALAPAAAALQGRRDSALSEAENLLAPATSALQGNLSSALSRVEAGVTIPQLGLPLLARPELPGMTFGQAPAQSAVGSMNSPVTALQEPRSPQAPSRVAALTINDAAGSPASVQATAPSSPAQPGWPSDLWPVHLQRNPAKAITSLALSLAADIKKTWPTSLHSCATVFQSEDVPSV